MKLDNLKNKLKIKIKNTTFFKKKFSFESGIDITNENEVLYRKNVVIKNILFITNLLYTVIFTLIAIGYRSPMNWLISILLFPITFFVNYTLSRLIKKGSQDKMSQTIAMYFSCFYIFLSSILVYIKLKFGNYSSSSGGDSKFLQECGYILLYYALLICAFYQNKKLLKNIFIWVFILITVLHFTVTYTLVQEAEHYDSPFSFLGWFFGSEDFRDILIRTVLLVLYMMVLYIYVSMADYMQQERVKELVKRRKVQEDFTNVVTKIFDVTLKGNTISEDEKRDMTIVSSMSSKLASLLSYDPNTCEEIYNYSKITVTKNVDFHIDENISEDEKFAFLSKQTELGSSIISRLQLSRKCEDIIRATLEGGNDESFMENQKKIQNNPESQIILICEMYVTMRGIRSYKRPYNHQKTITFMESELKPYFDNIIFERFIRFQDDFESLYNDM
ncbi:MAG: hypothetical protein K5892_03510 [Acholeplasmatales bacterium]|nr:hypothetical protein [Acholeplasmatales bacterium]